MQETQKTPMDADAELADRFPMLDNASRARLLRYVSLLLEHNRSVNLTATRDRGAAFELHILDSLTALGALKRLEAGSAVADVGSGGGSPGIPLAIARPDLSFALIEATKKKTERIESMVRDLGLDARVRVVRGRAEELAHDPALRERFDAAVSRGVAALPALLELCLPLVRPGGFLLAYKGKDVRHEIEASRRAARILGAGAIELERTERGTLVRVNKDRSSPPRYPREPGRPAASPL